MNDFNNQLQSLLLFNYPLEGIKEQKIASFKLPEKLIFVNKLPRNAVGKVLKSALIEQVASNEVIV